MAKGARASTKKANKQKLKSRVFGPVEDARTARLSAKLLELVSQPKPKPTEPAGMDVEGSSAEEKSAAAPESKQVEEMEIDGGARSNLKKSSKGRIEKRRSSSRKASIVFPRFKDGKKIGRTKGKK